MNYYDLSGLDVQGWYYGTRAMNCCACTEAVVQDITHGPPERKVQQVLGLAIYQNRTLLHWNLVESIKSNREVEPFVVMLPNTTFIGEYKNRNTRRKIRSYVTNLTKEW